MGSIHSWSTVWRFAALLPMAAVLDCGSSAHSGGNAPGAGGRQNPSGGAGGASSTPGTGGEHTGTGGASAGPSALGGAGGTPSGQGGVSSGTAATGGARSIDAGADARLATDGRIDAAAKGGAGGASSDGGGASKTGGAGGNTIVPVAQLPVIKDMPDPLTMNDGTKITTVEQWRARRQEMIAILEDYEYGHAPPPPGNVKAATTTAVQRITVSGSLKADYRMFHLTFGPDEKLGFDLGLFTPVVAMDAGAKFPVLIYLTYAADKSSLSDASVALSRGHAVATIGYQQLGADSTSWASSAFFPAYPDYDWRDIAAWAWGMSRAVDYLVTDSSIDPAKIMITGVSRLGQAVLLAGAFDERIALSAPVAAGAALRFSGKEMGGGLGQGITEIVDQNTYWFGPHFADFKNQTPRLPCDQHWLPALTASRLFIMCNSLQDQYGRAYAAAQTYLAAKPVYDFLGVPDNIGVNFREGTHGITSEDWSAILDFADQHLLQKGGTRRFDVLPDSSEMP